MQNGKALNALVVLLGPSGVGKTTLIQELLKRSDQFEYVRPYMTRPLRQGEQDKISVTEDVFSQMQKRGDFLVVNEHYGFKYGTPKTTIVDLIAQGRTPLLDYQLITIDTLVNPAFKLISIYIRPDTIEEWAARLKLSEQFDPIRLEKGRAELERVIGSNTIPNVNYVVTNQDGHRKEAADTILNLLRNTVS